MRYIKRIVCFANSLKNSGRCVAGREVTAEGYGSWIRPVSARPTGELSLVECRYEDESSTKLLDIVDVHLSKPAPLHHQTENHVIDRARYWTKAGELGWTELEKLVERPDSLWPNGEHTRHGVNDCVSGQLARMLTSSLVLIRPESVAIRVGMEGASEFPRKTRALFKYAGVDYSLKVTDPVAEEPFQMQGDGEYPLDDVYFCVSLTEPWERDGRCYKIVAGIVGRRPY
jgi:hypothetical protein